jgi:hypothetical protein
VNSAIGASKLRAVVGHHLVAALHGAHRGGDGAAAGVFEGSPGAAPAAGRHADARTSCTAPSASVMIQWRLSSCAATLPVLRMVMW